MLLGAGLDSGRDPVVRELRQGGNPVGERVGWRVTDPIRRRRHVVGHLQFAQGAGISPICSE